MVRCPRCSGVDETWNRTYAARCRTCGEALDPHTHLANQDWADGGRVLREGLRERIPLPEEFLAGLKKQKRAKLLAAPGSGWVVGLGLPDQGESLLWWRPLCDSKATFTPLTGTFRGHLRMVRSLLPDLLLAVFDASMVLFRLDPRPGVCIERVQQWTWSPDLGRPQDPLLVEPDPSHRSLTMQGVTLDDANQLRRFRLDLGSHGKDAGKATLDWSKGPVLKPVSQLAGPFQDRDRILLLARGHQKRVCKELDPLDLDRKENVDLPKPMLPTLKAGSVVHDSRRRRLLALREDRGVDVWHLEDGSHHTLASSDAHSQFGDHSLHLAPDGTLLLQRGGAHPCLFRPNGGAGVVVQQVQSHVMPAQPLFLGRDVVLVTGGALAPCLSAIPLAHENAQPAINTYEETALAANGEPLMTARAAKGGAQVEGNKPSPGQTARSAPDPQASGKPQVKETEQPMKTVRTLAPGQAPASTLGGLAWLDLQPPPSESPALVVCLPPIWKGKT